MIETIETRWFRLGSLPQPVIDWFEALPGPTETEERVDQYCRLGDPVALGLKVRAAARVEIKLREQELGARTFCAGLAGQVDRWAKWSFNLDRENPGTADLSRPAGVWFPVAKSRRTLGYRVSSDGRVTSGPEPVGEAEGCDIELVELMVDDRQWWSLALEADGTGESLQRNFDAVAALAFVDTPGAPQLSVDDSFSYPQWLHRTLHR